MLNKPVSFFGYRSSGRAGERPRSWSTKTGSTLLAILLLAVCSAITALANAPAAEIVQARALAARIETPAVRAAMQCRVAFEDASASVPIKNHADEKGIEPFWASYLEKLGGIDVAACPTDFRNAFKQHLRAVRLIDNFLNKPSPQPSSLGGKAGSGTGGHDYTLPDSTSNGGQIGGHRDMRGDCIRTYQALFTIANKSIKAAPVGDRQLAGQIDRALKE